MRNGEAGKLLKLFLASHLQLENYLFWMEVEKFQVYFKVFADRLNSQFVEEGSLNQVNIDAKMREALVKKIKCGEINIKIFDTAHAEIYKVLNQNNYNAFLQSEFCKEFVRKKREDNEMENLRSMSVHGEGDLM
jgi:hypothetical protein